MSNIIILTRIIDLYIYSYRNKPVKRLLIGLIIKKKMSANRPLNVLVIEDRENFSIVAERYLTSKDVVASFARDYEEAIQCLNQNYNGVLVDLFFPEKLGSGNIEIGRKLIDRVCDDVINSLDFRPGILKHNFYDIWEEIIHSYGHIGETEELEEIIKKNGKKFDDESRGVLEFYREIMQKNLKKDERNQPLGILIAENVSCKTPFLFTTSTGHHSITTNLICCYQRLKKWPEMIDAYCRKPKDSLDFWEIAFRNLLVKIEGEENRIK